MCDKSRPCNRVGLADLVVFLHFEGATISDLPRQDTIVSSTLLCGRDMRPPSPISGFEMEDRLASVHRHRHQALVVLEKL